MVPSTINANDFVDPVTSFSATMNSAFLGLKAIGWIAMRFGPRIHVLIWDEF